MDPRIVIQGNLILAQGLIPSRGNPEPAPRREISAFSKAARKRMIRECTKMGEAVPIFVTLTYGAEWPSHPWRWKNHLDIWWKRLRRTYGDLGAIWRLEPQERGAPHFHLLVYHKSGKRPYLPHEWVSENWAEITGGNPQACSRVEALKSHRGGMFYVAKYCAKLAPDTLPDGWEYVGKHWGRLSALNLPICPQKEMLLHSELEQRAILFVMADAFKEAWIRTQAAKYDDPADGYYMAQQNWKEMKEENKWFGNTGTFFGSAESFMEKVSAKIRELQDRASSKVFETEFDKALALA